MKAVPLHLLSRRAAFLAVIGFATMVSAQTQRLRIVTYNIQDDVTQGTITFTTPLAGLITPFSGTGTFTTSSSGTVTNGGVLEGIGEEIVAGTNQPIDILALQETSGNSTTVQPILNGLNAFYSSRTNVARYAMSPLNLTTTGGDGGGPNALVYNTNTVQLLESVGVGTPSGNGEPRQVGRYLFAPAGVATNASNTFYIYVSHYKSGTDTNTLFRRAVEAGVIRTNSATLPANSRILYVGDYNISTSTETSYQDIVTSTYVTIGIQGVDPLNLSSAKGIDWTASSSLNVKTESCRSLHYRDDFQVMSSNVYQGVAGGLAYITGTYHTFGNNGSIPYENSAITGNNALNSDLQPNPPISAAQCYTNLYGGSDHLPVVADYTIPLPAAAPSASFAGNPTNGVAPLNVTFSDTSTGSITNWSWNFGDGGTTNLATNSVVYTYTTAGVYTVTEIVSGSGGSSTNTQVNYITVLTPFQAWQIQYFGSTTNPAAAANADPDGDGQNNLAEFLAGTDPTNGASGLQITSVTTQGSDVLVTWMTAGGYTNVVQATAGLPDGSYSTNFQDLSGLIIISGSGDAVTNYLDSGGATNAPSRYYRIRVQP
jgi:PKD repeat protein